MAKGLTAIGGILHSGHGGRLHRSCSPRRTISSTRGMSFSPAVVTPSSLRVASWLGSPSSVQSAVGCSRSHRLPCPLRGWLWWPPTQAGRSSASESIDTAYRLGGCILYTLEPLRMRYCTDDTICARASERACGRGSSPWARGRRQEAHPGWEDYTARSSSVDAQPGLEISGRFALGGLPCLAPPVPLVPLALPTPWLPLLLLSLADPLARSVVHAGQMPRTASHLAQPASGNPPQMFSPQRDRTRRR